MRRKLVTLLFVVAALQSFGQYCIPNFDFTSEFLDQVELTKNGSSEWINASNGQSGNGYGNFSGNGNFIAIVEPGDNLDLRFVTDGNQNGSSHYARVLVDWNNDQDFFDLGEVYLVASQSGNHPRTFNSSFTVPATAVLGDVRMRIVYEYETGAGPYAAACEDDSYGEAEDYTLRVCDGVAMSLDNVLVNQESTNSVGKGTTQNQILGIKLTTSNCASPIVLHEMRFNEGASDALATDVSNIQLFYTGSEANFNASNQVGSAMAGSNFSITDISDNLDALAQGDNWFWLTYDIDANAQLDNHVDAALTSMIIDTENASNSTVAVNNGDPAGKRLIVNSYCVPEDGQGDPFGDGAHVTQVTMDKLDNASGFAPYFNYAAQLKPFDACVGVEYNLEVQYNISRAFIDGQFPLFIHAYFDWNRDGDFVDKDEHYLLGNDQTLLFLVEADRSGTVNNTIVPPQHALPGTSVMRVMITQSAAATPCVATVTGEAEDYSYVLHKAGELSTASTIPLCETQSVQLEAINGQTGFLYQKSNNRTSWQTLSISGNSVTTDAIDTTTYFRIMANNASCPNGQMYSDIVDVPFVGLQNVQQDQTEICVGDTVQLSGAFEYPIAIFETENAVTATNQPAEMPLVVSGISPATSNSVTLDSLCIDVSINNMAAGNLFMLYAPDASDAQKLVLSYGNGSSNFGTGNTVCFVRDGAPSVTSVSGVLSGTYTPEHSLSRFDGVDPNGTWKLVAVSEDLGGRIDIDAFRMFFGVNDTIRWSPADSTSATVGDSISVFPAESTTYTASLQNVYCNTSEDLPIAVFEEQPIAVTLEKSPSVPVCAGTSFTFATDVDNASEQLTYQWRINGDDVVGATQEEFTSADLEEGDEVSIFVASTNACGTFTALESTIISFLPELDPTLAIASDRNFPVCEGIDASFTCDTSSFGPNAGIKWFINGSEMQEGGTLFSPSGLNDMDVISVTVTGEYPCLTTTQVERSITYRSIKKLQPKITVESEQNDQTICQNSLVRIVADTSFNNSGGNGTLQWYHNGQQFTYNGLVFESDTFGNGNHEVKVAYQIPGTCTESNLEEAAISFFVDPSPTPDVVFSASKTRICAGETISFDVTTIENGGASPKLQWLLNGEKLPGETGTSFITSELRTGDEVNVRLESSLRCATFLYDFASPVKIIVSQPTLSEIRINAETEMPICEGEPLTASVSFLEGGGSNPIYDWLLNGTSIQRNGISTITLPAPKNGDELVARLITDVVCPIDPEPMSNNIVIAANELPDSQFRFDQESDESYSFIPASSDFIEYRWDFGDGSTSLQTTPNHKFTTNGKYQVCLTITDANFCTNTTCEEVSYITSIRGTQQKQALQVYPNPTSGVFWIQLPANTEIEQLQALDNAGRILTIPYSQTTTESRIQCDFSKLSSGMYTIILQSKTGQLTQRISLSKE